MEPNISRYIKRIFVSNLFGLYDYELSLHDSNTESNKILILYGDNGSGKTTILKLAFHLLASEDRKGHKTVAASTPFARFEIEFQDKTKVWAARTNGRLIGSFSMGIKRPGRKEKIVEFIADKDNIVRRQSKKNNEMIQSVLSSLKQLQISLYMLSDDRTIHFSGQEDKSLSVYKIESENELIELDEEDEARIRRRRYQLDTEEIAQYHLTESLRRTEEWIKGKAIRSSSIGDSSANVLYNEMLRRLVSLPEEKSIDATAIKKSIKKRVIELEKQSKQLAQYGLLPKFSGKEIKSVISIADLSNIEIIINVLSPYLESLEKKIEAMDDVYKRINSLVTIINRFLTNKKLEFDLHSGLSITSIDGSLLKPQMLSSGERHLLLLFCNSLIEVDRPSILMIDEPEISLNIKWQRILISSLIECIGDSPVQYLFATHSMELLVKHRNRVMKLENLKKS